MKRILILLAILVFSITQTMALRCGLVCSIHELTQKSKMSQHGCCPKAKQQSQDKRKAPKCFGHAEGTCFYQSFESKSLDLKSLGEIHFQMFASQELIQLNRVSFSKLERMAKYKFLQASFLFHQSRKKIYIFQDKFLI